MTHELFVISRDQSLITRHQRLITREGSLITCHQRLIMREEGLMMRHQRLITRQLIYLSCDRILFVRQPTNGLLDVSAEAIG